MNKTFTKQSNTTIFKQSKTNPIKYTNRTKKQTTNFKR